MAAAVVVAAIRRSIGGGQDQEEEDKHELDEDNDGNITSQELLNNFHKIDVRADVFVQVLTLEKNLAGMMLKLPNFLVCMICFIIALIEFSPPESTFNVHRRLVSHYGLDTVRGIVDFSGIYDYIVTFEARNQEMQATSYRYWCEHRYSVHRWDEHLMIPVHQCNSPRLYSLRLLTDESLKWTPPANTSGSSSSGSSSSGRRLAGGASSSSGITATQPVPQCVDYDDRVQLHSGDPNATCYAWARDPHHAICEGELGILDCPMTCGYCSPFVYDHLYRFERPQVTMFPAMIYQTRFAKSDCHGFASTYENQPYNPVLTLLPALDGAKNDRVLTCIDRTQHMGGLYAIELDCTPDTPAYSCHNGKVQITKKHLFHGEIIYPQLLVEPSRDIARMREVEWVDLQSDTVSLSTMVYTEGVEIFTSVTVDFKMDEAGNVDGTYSMISYRDMINGSKTTFIVCLIVCSSGALIGVVLSVIYMLRHSTEGKRGMFGYELASRLLLCIYPIVLLIEWSKQIPMSQEYDHLLHSFLDLGGIGLEHMDVAYDKYFEAKTHIYHEITWLKRHRIVAYVVCYFQFLQLIFYFNNHPKMAVLTATIHKAVGNISHFMALFGILFVMLAFMAHWMLGPYLYMFGTIGETMKSQVRMVFGEFIEADNVGELKGSMMAMYWLYAGTFMLLVIWTLLNFFLAIIVDAFVDVKSENEKDVAARDFMTDTCGTVYSLLVSKRNGWPSREELITFFADEQRHFVEKQESSAGFLKQLAVDGKSQQEEALKCCPPKDIVARFPNHFTDESLARFLVYYYKKCPQILNAKPSAGQQSAAAKEAGEQASSSNVVVDVAMERGEEPVAQSELQSAGGTNAQSLQPTAVEAPPRSEEQRQPEQPVVQMVSFMVNVGADVIKLGFLPRSFPPEPMIIGAVSAGSWSAENGIMVGDEFVAVNGVGVEGFNIVDLDRYLARERPLQLTFRRQLDTSSWNWLGLEPSVKATSL